MRLARRSFCKARIGQPVLAAQRACKIAEMGFLVHPERDDALAAGETARARRAAVGKIAAPLRLVAGLQIVSDGRGHQAEPGLEHRHIDEATMPARSTFEERCRYGKAGGQRGGIVQHRCPGTDRSAFGGSSRFHQPACGLNIHVIGRRVFLWPATAIACHRAMDQMRMAHGEVGLVKAETFHCLRDVVLHKDIGLCQQPVECGGSSLRFKIQCDG